MTKKSYVSPSVKWEEILESDILCGSPDVPGNGGEGFSVFGDD